MISSAFISGTGVTIPASIILITFTGITTSLLDVSVKIIFRVALPSPTSEVSG